MKPPTDPASIPSDPLWQVVLARDQALIETRKTYDKRCAELGAAVKSTKEYLAGMEKDRDDSQAALREAQAATEKTIQYLRLVEQDRDQARHLLTEAQTAHQSAMDQTVGYLQAVEQDRAERLKSIETYQSKLREAYSDLERNVAYLKTLETEIQKHIALGAKKDAIIAELSARLNAATPPPPAGP